MHSNFIQKDSLNQIIMTIAFLDKIIYPQFSKWYHALSEDKIQTVYAYLGMICRYFLRTNENLIQNHKKDFTSTQNLLIFEIYFSKCLSKIIWNFLYLTSDSICKPSSKNWQQKKTSLLVSRSWCWFLKWTLQNRKNYGLHYQICLKLLLNILKTVFSYLISFYTLSKYDFNCRIILLPQNIEQ